MPHAKFQSPSINIDRDFQLSFGEREKEREKVRSDQIFLLSGNSKFRTGSSCNHMFFSVDQVIYLSIFVRQYLYVILKVISQSYK